MCIRPRLPGKSVRFREPPWPEGSPPWEALDRALPANHVARLLVQQIRRLDLSALEGCYQGRGSMPYRPDLMLRIALLEIQRGHPSPSQWCRAARENQAA